MDTEHGETTAGGSKCNKLKSIQDQVHARWVRYVRDRFVNRTRREDLGMERDGGFFYRAVKEARGGRGGIPCRLSGAAVAPRGSRWL